MTATANEQSTRDAAQAASPAPRAKRGARAALALLPLGYCVVVVVALAAHPRPGAAGRAALLPPVLVSLALLWSFGRSLAPGRMPMIERFARRIDGDLSPARVAHCRGVTRVWCAFFASNAAVTTALALAAPVSWWALWTGALTYVAIGALLGGEYLLRRRRFPR
jgi:uncharacterized membrane protein